MKRLITILIAFIFISVSCQHEEIWDKLNEHEHRIEQLEKQCKELNANVVAVQAALVAVQANDYVTDVMKVVENGIEIGYSLTFAKGGTVTVYHGKDGANGNDGLNGIDGAPGVTPNIGVNKADDGVYYWTINGEWLTDDAGLKVSAIVPDPSAGYIIPRFRIADNIWYISYDNGQSWQKIVGSEESAEPVFSKVDVNPDYILFTLADNTQFKIPTQKAIDDMQSNYWAGKKMIINGDSIPYGSGLSSVKDAFPYLVAEELGMSVINYSIGGTTVAKRTGDYDECYVSWNSWTADRDNGLLNTSKKYLVNTGKNAPRIYQIYSYDGTQWVAGGNASNKAGRTPLSDRISAMDKDADVVMIMVGSNDFYYNWAPFGNFEDGTYRGLGYGSSGTTKPSLGELDTENNLLSSDVVELVEHCAPTANGSILDMSYTAYFTYRNIPVAGGRKVKVPYGRRGWWLNMDGDDISTINFTSGTSDFTAVAPDDAAYLTICFKYDEVDPMDCVAYMSGTVPSDENHDGKSSDEPNETFYDGLHKLCKYTRHTYPKADIIFLTPIKRVQQDVWDCIYSEDMNVYGKTLDDYRKAIIRCCEYYSINYIDLYTISGLNPHIDPSMFADTGKAVHPNEEGHRKIASIITANMRSMR